MQVLQSNPRYCVHQNPVRQSTEPLEKIANKGKCLTSETVSHPLGGHISNSPMAI